MINVELLKKTCETPGAPGYEQRIREFILAEVTPLADKVEVDAMGNVIAIKKGQQDKKVMVAAHMDEIGFIDRVKMAEARLDDMTTAPEAEGNHPANCLLGHRPSQGAKR